MMTTITCILLLSCCCVCLVVGQKDEFRSQTMKSQNMDPLDPTEWGIPDDDEYPLQVELRLESFDHHVIRARDPWIVVIYKNALKWKWGQHSHHVKGGPWYGTVNFDKERVLVSDWAPNVTAENIGDGVALVFPFGVKAKRHLKEVRTNWPKFATQPQQAEDIVTSSMTDLMSHFSFKPQQMKAFNDWIVDSYYHSNPPRFPVLCVTDLKSPKIPLPFLFASSYFATYFKFAVVRKEDVPKMQLHFKELPAPEKYPTMYLLLGKEPSHEEMERGSFGMFFNIMPYLEAKYGNPNQFVSIIKYLFTANEDYRKMLPGRNPGEIEAVSNMQAVRSALTKRVDMLKPYKPKHVRDEL